MGMKGECYRIGQISLMLSVALFLSVVFAGCLFFSDESDADFQTIEVDGIIYEVSNSDATIIGCIDGLSDLVIPSTFTYQEYQYDVNGIKKEAFAYNRSIEVVEFPDKNMTIGKNAFMECTSLVSVKLTKAIISSDCLFLNCSSLKQATIVEGTTSIPYSCFHGCSSLVDVHIEGDEIVIDPAAFMNCTSLIKIVLPPVVYDYAPNCFHGCLSLEEMIISGESSRIGSQAFSGCSSLKSIVVMPGVRTIEDLSLEYLNLDLLVVPKTIQNLSPNALRESTVRHIMIDDSIDTNEITRFLQPCDYESVHFPLNLKVFESEYKFYDGSTLLSDPDKVVFANNIKGKTFIREGESYHVCDKLITYESGGLITDVVAPLDINFKTEYFSNPSATGYFFDSWYLDPYFKQKWSGIKGTESMTVYGKFYPITYRVVFHSNNDMELTYEQIMTYDVSEKLVTSAFEWKYHTFDKWMTTPDLMIYTEYYLDQQFVKNLCSTQDSTFDLYASWIREDAYVSIYYECVAPGTDDFNASVLVGSSHIVDTFSYDIPGYTFKYWSDGNNKYYPGDIIEVGHSDIYLKAVFDVDIVQTSWFLISIAIVIVIILALIGVYIIYKRRGG